MHIFVHSILKNKLKLFSTLISNLFHNLSYKLFLTYFQIKFLEFFGNYFPAILGNNSQNISRKILGKHGEILHFT